MSVLPFGRVVIGVWCELVDRTFFTYISHTNRWLVAPTQLTSYYQHQHQHQDIEVSPFVGAFVPSFLPFVVIMVCSKNCSTNAAASSWMVTATAFAAGSLATALYFHYKSSLKSIQGRVSFPATLLRTDRPTTTSTTSTTATPTADKTPPPTSPPPPAASIESTYPIYDYENDNQGSFLKMCDYLIQDIVHNELPTHYHLPPREVEWIHKMLTTTVKGGKMNRGIMVVQAGVTILQQQHPNTIIDNTTLCRLAILGWAIEWLQAWLLIADDIMDSSVTRRGQPCWYKTLGEAWYIAINDAVTIESLVYTCILKKHFAYDAELLLQLWDVMMETTLQTELGQLSDTLCDILELKDLTVSRWEWIVTYKTSYYSFYLSVAFAMIMARISDPHAYQAARDILIIMGVYFQAQDDFLDCYGTPEQIGKIGTDIQDKKCGWLFTKAYHELITTPEQKALLDTYYGNCKVSSPQEQAIKALYTELGLPQLYARYEQDSYDKIMAMKESHVGATLQQAGVPWQVFETFLQKVYKRSK